MAKDTKISNAAAIASVNAVAALLDAGAGAAYVEIRNGSKPADVSVAATGVVLANLTCSATAFGGAVDNTGEARATANAVTQDTDAVAGTPTWFRAYDSNGVPVIDGTYGISDADMIGDKATFNTGDDVSITSWTLSQPE